MNMRTAVGMLVFSQFWFWYPLCLFLGLAFTPTAIITLNPDLKVECSQRMNKLVHLRVCVHV